MPRIKGPCNTFACEPGTREEGLIDAEEPIALTESRVSRRRSVWTDPCDQDDVMPSITKAQNQKLRIVIQNIFKSPGVKMGGGVVSSALLNTVIAMSLVKKTGDEFSNQASLWCEARAIGQLLLQNCVL